MNRLDLWDYFLVLSIYTSDFHDLIQSALIFAFIHFYILSPTTIEDLVSLDSLFIIYSPCFVTMSVFFHLIFYLTLCFTAKLVELLFLDHWLIFHFFSLIDLSAIRDVLFFQSIWPALLFPFLSYCLLTFFIVVNFLFLTEHPWETNSVFPFVELTYFYSFKVQLTSHPLVFHIHFLFSGLP